MVDRSTAVGRRDHALFSLIVSTVARIAPLLEQPRSCPCACGAGVRRLTRWPTRAIHGQVARSARTSCDRADAIRSVRRRQSRTPPPFPPPDPSRAEKRCSTANKRRPL